MNRRQFLSYSATLAAAASVSYLGHRYLNRRPGVSVNLAGLPRGHAVRDGFSGGEPQRKAHCETLILGSGAAGLGALWYLVKNGSKNIVLAEGFERNGNNAAYRFQEMAAPTGAHYLALPSEESVYVRELLRDLGILLSDGVYNETDLVHAPESRLLFQGKWQESLLPREDADSRRFFALTGRLKTLRGADGKKVFAIPIAESSHDNEWRRLDTMTFAQWLDAENYRSETLRWYLDYCCRDDYGQGIAQVSAFAGLHYFAARGDNGETVLTWPQGLARLSDGMRQLAGLESLAAMPSETAWMFGRPVALDAAAVKIREVSDGFEVWLRDNGSGQAVAVTAENVICAMPLAVAARVVDNPAQYGFGRLPESAPWLVSNFVMHPLPPETADPAWDSVVYRGKGLGYVDAAHQLIRVGVPQKALFTAYAALDHDTPQNVRRMLLAAKPEQLLDIAAQDLLEVYGKRFWQYVEHVDITVRGHGMAVPKAGYLSDKVLEKLRNRLDGLLFAHSDLSGYSVFEEALYWGVEAARKVLAEQGEVKTV
ncbi:FAD-dependent oxidoreductase [Neisseria sp.]|uniref:FAD-dependent oxidoreductase n=1 Tax=Neisseria sp. TaxID=192066 RepID=UPI00359F87C1